MKVRIIISYLIGLVNIKIHIKYLNVGVLKNGEVPGKDECGNIILSVCLVSAIFNIKALLS